MLTNLPRSFIAGRRAIETHRRAWAFRQVQRGRVAPLGIPPAARDRMRLGRYLRCVGPAAAALALGACLGHGSSDGAAAPSAATYSVGGNVTGLQGETSLVLQVNGADNTPVFGNGSFAFSTPLPGGATYTVTVLTQPQGQSCLVAGGSGTVAGDVTDVVVTCTPAGHYAVGGSLSGLIPGNQVIMANNGANSTTLTNNGSFAFSSLLASGTPYAVTVLTQPANQSCSVANGSGTLAAAAVDNIVVNCSGNNYNVGGSVTGLLGNTRVTLLDNGQDSLTVTNGSFTFNTPVAAGAGYSVTLAMQPAGQQCTVGNASGTIGSSAVTSVAVSCTPDAYAISGNVTGLLAQESVVLQDNGGDNTAITGNGSFAFAIPVDSGSSYAVTILAQPADQTCAVSAGSGTVAAAAIGNIAVNCSGGTVNVGVDVAGLAGAGLVLQDNGGDNLAIGANGLAYFATPLATGAPYAVTIAAQPGGQTCSVVAGSGTTGTANVTVAVGCAGLTRAWDWIAGADSVDAAGVYGSQDVPAPLDAPGARNYASAGVDPSGNAWLFGGYGYARQGAIGELNDLWRYAGGQWTWVSGSSSVAASGIYGSRGSPAAGNTPGGRQSAASWVDASGNFWLFGGSGSNAAGTFVFLNDLWKFAAGQWTWVSGSDTVGASGTYGSLGVAAPGNTPGARQGAVSWVDAAGNLWLFGGYGLDSAGSIGVLNDLWMYAGGQWTWVAGADTVNAGGVYGSAGVAAPGNGPGARYLASAAIDPSGNAWLFGGVGVDAQGRNGYLNDLWEFRAGQWTWIGGSSTANAAGSYGALGAAAAGNAPGARQGANLWIDGQDRLWLFGGAGLDSTGSNGVLDDLWQYGAGQWTWVGGSTTQGASGSNGSPGVAAAGNMPGARSAAANWVDAAGQLWLFGGIGSDSAGAVGYLNDLWRYVP